VLAHVHLCHLQLLHSDRRFFIAQIPTTAWTPQPCSTASLALLWSTMLPHPFVTT
jgi:hypothetical protein